MRALVVYESMYGNTHVVASNIADGLRAGHDVILVPVGEATGELLAWADLVIVGAPTHMHQLSTPASRQMAAQAAASQASGLKLDPDAGGLGLRDWFDSMPPGRVLAAAFDTRINDPGVCLSEREIRPNVRDFRPPGTGVTSLPARKRAPRS